jgi:citrate lyase subunit beta/citryl-CoA lyase
VTAPVDAADILRRTAARDVGLEPRFLVQMAHLTTPATVWRYVESACTKSAANLVMLDLEDSIPRGDDRLLAEGRANVVRALRELDWGPRLRFFRPRGLELDPELHDLTEVVRAAGDRLEGIVYPKVESADEVRLLDAKLDELERERGLKVGAIKIEVLIESAAAEAAVFEIAAASRRLAGLVFGAFDYWSSLQMVAEPYRTDHPLIDHARCAIVKAAASVGVPAIAEMTLNYPTRDKSEADRVAALEDCRRDARHARTFGFRGKWTGIPAQTEIALEVFTLPDELVAQAVEHARLFLAAEREGRGATMIGGKMADRATDRVNRVALRTAYLLGKLDAETARELGIA